MRKGTKLPIMFESKVVGEAEVLDQHNGPIGITITDPIFEQLISSKLVEGVAYRPIGTMLVAIPRYKDCEPHSHMKMKEN